MAAYFSPRRSLVHDNVDCYNKWAVLLFSTLTLIALLMPFSPGLGMGYNNNDDDVQMGLRYDGNSGGSRIPQVKFKASCWCPAHFAPSQVKYANAVCSATFSGPPRGIKYKKQMDWSQRPFFDFHKDYLKTVEKQKALEGKVDDLKQKTRELIVYRAPLVLFLLALCLKLPQILWTLLTEAMPSCVNVDQVTESCGESRSQDMTSQRQACEETIKAVASSGTKARNTTSSLYLLMKLFTAVVIVAEIIAVSLFILPDIHSSQSHSAKYSTAAKSLNQDLETKLMNLFNYPQDIFIYRCFFKVRIPPSVVNYNLQCAITYDNEGAEASMASTSKHQSSAASETPAGLPANHIMLLLHQAIFTAVLALLAILLIANVINTASWFLKLLNGSYATSLGLPSNASMDVVLLVYMTRLNERPCGACRSRFLAGSSASWANAVEADSHHEEAKA